MNARRAARELALLSFFQLDKQEDQNNLEKEGLKDLIQASVRALTDQAREQIEESAHQLAQVSQSILEQEQEHPVNLASPIGAEIKPVPISTTQEMVERIEKCLLAAEYLYEALRIPELAVLSDSEEVQQYAVRLIKLVRQHQTELDELLNQCSEDWRVDRLIKMDRYILRLAAAEMKYITDVEPGVAINEAIELSKQFSTAESYRLINGILGRLAEVLLPEASTEQTAHA